MLLWAGKSAYEIDVVVLGTNMFFLENPLFGPTSIGSQSQLGCFMGLFFFTQNIKNYKKP